MADYNNIDDMSSLEALEEELHFQKEMLKVLDDSNISDKEEAKKQCQIEIMNLKQKVIHEETRRFGKLPNTPGSSKFTVPFRSPLPASASSRSRDIPNYNMDGPSDDMNPGFDRKRRNHDLSPDSRESKSRRTTPSYSGAAAPDKKPSSDNLNRQKEYSAKQANHDTKPMNPPGTKIMTSSSFLPSSSSRTKSTMASQPKTNYKPKFTPGSSSKGYRDIVELTDSSDSDLKEIAPAQFKSNGRKPSTPSSSLKAASSPIDLTRNMNGSLVRPNQITGPSRNFSFSNRIVRPPRSSVSSSRDSVAPPAAGIGGTSVYKSAKAMDLDSGNTSDAADYPNRNPIEAQQELRDLLNQIQDDDLVREGTPEGLVYPLYEHQKVALSWMIRAEMSVNKGGILADDMGLGKTISTLALILANPPDKNSRRKTTLIVGPVALARQWRNEIRDKIKPTHKLSVFLYHGNNKATWEEMSKYDVVITTYGTLASQFKKFIKWQFDHKDISPEAIDQAEMTKVLPFMSNKSLWYRVILDEAQCIKNKDTATSKACGLLRAINRFCLTGTPLMNSIKEMFSLIRFLRIRPYNDWLKFRDAFGSLISVKDDMGLEVRQQAMSRLRAVIKAIMLRRTKQSLIDGKPILTLPEKVEIVDHVVLDEDELSYYNTIESKTKDAFNRYRKAGTIGKNYANVLVLLLRLRQAACHPHIIFDYEEAPSSDELMVKLAESLSPDVIGRIMAADQFECPVCYDPVLNPKIILPCGHDICGKCLVKVVELLNARIAEGEENQGLKCPTCRGEVNLQEVIDYATFKQAHMGASHDDDDDTDSDSESESDSVEDQDLDGFVVPDDYVSDDDKEYGVKGKSTGKAKVKSDLTDESDLEDILPADPTASTSSKGKGPEKKKLSKTKGKGKAKDNDVKKHLNLSSLRKESTKSKKHMRRYKRYLKANFVPSAKITKCVELVQDAIERKTKTIVFSQFTALLDLIEVPLKELGFRFSRYDGTMSADARHEAVRMFREGSGCDVFLVSLKAGNSGLNLVEATNVIIMDPFWNPYIEMQAVDRAHRIGQQKTVMVHRIVIKGTVEDRILFLQEQKREMVESALDENASRKLAQLGQQELIFLFNGR